ncbi:ATP-dependent helicase HepA [Spirochaetia bacterium]|nr:ATP-dependent helicase HepA [Spirochaetia bacterium]
MSDAVVVKSDTYKPGSLIRARGREWVVEPSSSDVLLLRPLGGSNEEIQAIIPELEIMPIEDAVFPPPDINKPGPFYSAILLRDALLMKCRAGAGPFRGFGNIAVEPRAYQLVPLLMALKQETVRLLIADDVGIGKTIEAALIARELLDRGEVDRFSVLCPPHLVEQWVGELKNHFHIDAVAVTAGNIKCLERDAPRGVSIFDYYIATVTSLDYIKIPEHRAYFIANAPMMVIVDEAHTCTNLGQGKQQRYELLKKLSEHAERHLVMLTATPHSGNQNGFSNLLSLLRPDFADLAVNSLAGNTQNRALREELSNYFVQRRRLDINEWNDQSLFPNRKTKEAVYKLSGKWDTFFEKIRSYCFDLAQRAEKAHGKEITVIWYAVIALLRCVSSSPDAAKRALTTRLYSKDDELALTDDERIMDGIGDELILNDEEPAAQIEESSFLKSLIAETETLRGIHNDPKLAILVKEVEALINAKPRFKPVIFCRYIATAHYVADELREHFKDKPDVQVACITGEITSDEREEQVESLINDAGIPVLVATDCLSEGINLQHGFDAAIHYDLAWNPARHEQREGRVDRFGQKSSEVRCVMLYGENNPVDGLIFNVIIKKARVIRDALGILVPIPEDESKIQTAIVKAAIMKPSAKSVNQGMLDFGDTTDLEHITGRWQDAADKEKANRTIFAQRSLKPDDVLPEWRKQNEILGSEHDVERFVNDSLYVLNAPLENSMKGDRLAFYKFNPGILPAALKDRMQNEGIQKTMRLNFAYPPEKNAVFIHRSNPLVTILADYMLETALEQNQEGIISAQIAARCGVYETSAVNLVTSVFLVRLRHKIEMTRKGGMTKTTLAEEALLLGFEGRKNPAELPKEKLDALLGERPTGNLDKSVITRELTASLSWWRENNAVFEKIAKDRSNGLLADHRRVRQAAQDRGTFAVSPGLPVDLIGIYVLLPDGL